MVYKEKKRQKNKSLAGKVTLATIIGTSIIGLVGLVVGLVIFVRTLIGENTRDFLYVSMTARAFIKDDAAVDELINEVMDIYGVLTEEERAETGTEAYRRHFSGISQREDYQRLYDLLLRFRLLNAVDNIYLVVYDKENSSLVHIIDTDDFDELGFKTGEWEYIGEKDIEQFFTREEVPCYIHRSVDNKIVFSTGSYFSVIDDETYGMVMADFVRDDLTYDISRFMMRYVVAIAVAAIIFGLILNRQLKRGLVKPINEIANAARSYGKEGKPGEEKGNHFSSLDIHTGDEVEILGDVMKQMEQNLGTYVKKLTEMTAREERGRAELDTAAQIQKAALPDSFPAFPDRTEFDIYATMEPAKVVGGDFYDFFLIDDDHLCFVIADVSDKGIPASLFMMSAQTVIRSNALMGKSPADILTDTNAAICANNKLFMFVTVWLGILEISTGLLTYANAGHEPVVISRGDEGFEFVRGQKKPAIGMRPKVGFLEQEITLLPGDKVFLYTDGVTDAQVRRGEFFGRQRLLETLRNLDKDSCKFIIESVRDSISSFTGDVEQFDDMTMLCLKYNGMEVNFMYKLNDVVRIIAEGDKLFGHTGKVSSILNKETEKNIGVDIHFDAQDPQPCYYSEDELELVKEHIKEEDY